MLGFKDDVTCRAQLNVYYLLLYVFKFFWFFSYKILQNFDIILIFTVCRFAINFLMYYFHKQIFLYWFDVCDALVLLGKYLGTKKSGHLYANCDTMDEKTTFFFYLINRWGEEKRKKSHDILS
jgi:hypothetical protein